MASKNIVVAGDVTIDWLLRRESSSLSQPEASLLRHPEEVYRRSDVRMSANSQAGATALLGRFVKALTLWPPYEPFRNALYNDNVKVVDPSTMFDPCEPSPEVAKALQDPSHQKRTRAFSIWTRHYACSNPNSCCQPGAASIEPVWRVSEFCSIHPGKLPSTRSAADDPENVWCLVLHELGPKCNMFSDKRANLWPRCLSTPSEIDHVVIYRWVPQKNSQIWAKLTKSVRLSPVIFVLAVTDIVRAPSYLSWEQSVATVIHELSAERFSHLQEFGCSVLVVLGGSTGALVIEKTSGAILVFDPSTHERDWNDCHPGRCIGNLTCYAAAVIYGLAEGRPLSLSAKHGLAASRDLHRYGYDYDKENDQLKFPYGRICPVIFTSPEHLWIREMPVPYKVNGPLRTFALDELARASSRDPNIYVKLVQQGIDSLMKNRSGLAIPVEKVGKWESADRHEIEAIRSLKDIILEYCDRSTPKPLSLAVFGPPGSGKSFALSELVGNLATGKGRSARPLTFNLSQLRSPDSLASAFHLVRDDALRGEIPLVFWDEFDSPLNGQPLGWLTLFLAPMQDGEFLDNGIRHPIGRAIFVFAGGIYTTMEKFQRKADRQRETKARDFVSRLSGFLNVSGVNSQSMDDGSVRLRRAMLLRNLLMKHASNLLSEKEELLIDREVIQAFIGVRKYRHGARSMEAIIRMSNLAGQARFYPWCLPPEDQLGLHVNAQEFVSLMT